MKTNTLDVSIVSTCMNRCHYLDNALESWMRLPVKEIIIVDWSSTDFLKEIVQKHQDGRITIVRVNGKDSYHRTKPINIGFRYASSKYILKVDSDIILNHMLFKFIKLTDMLQGTVNFNLLKSKIEPDTNNLSLFGTCFLSKEMFNAVNGYNEILEGWGYEDDDFYKRIMKLFPHFNLEPQCIGNHIHHGEVVKRENLSKKYTQSHTLHQLEYNKKLCMDNPWVNKEMETFNCEVYLPNNQVEDAFI